MRRSVFIGVLLACHAGLSDPARARPAARAETWELRALTAESAVQLLERLEILPVGAWVLPHPRDPKRLLVHGDPAELRAVRDLVRSLDRPSKVALRLYVRPVIHVSARALAAGLQVLDSPGQAPLFMVADDRGSQLVLRTTRERYLVLDKLARRLDVPARSRVISVMTPRPEGFP